LLVATWAAAADCLFDFGATKAAENKSKNHKCLMANTYNNNNNESHD